LSIFFLFLFLNESNQSLSEESERGREFDLSDLIVLNVVLCCAVLCCGVLCCAVLRCVVLCCVVLCCVVLCCVLVLLEFVCLFVCLFVGGGKREFLFDGVQ
jgi:hypothetical protein